MNAFIIERLPLLVMQGIVSYIPEGCRSQLNDFHIAILKLLVRRYWYIAEAMIIDDLHYDKLLHWSANVCIRCLFAGFIIMIVQSIQYRHQISLGMYQLNWNTGVIMREEENKQNPILIYLHGESDLFDWGNIMR